MDAGPRVIRTSVPAQVAEFIRHAIEHGDVEPGALLPPERELAERYGASIGAVRQGLAMLVAEGRVTKINGKGTVVRGRPAPPVVITRTPDDPWTRLTPLGEPVHRRATADERTAALLGLEPGAALFIVEQTARHKDTGTPVLTRRVLPVIALDGIKDHPDPFGPRSTLVTALAERHGPLTAAERVRVLVLDADDRVVLNLGPGTLAIEITRITRGRSGTALLANVERYGEGIEPEFPLN